MEKMSALLRLVFITSTLIAGASHAQVNEEQIMISIEASCPNNYIEGNIKTWDIQHSGNRCFRLDSIKDKYLTQERNRCVGGFVEGKPIYDWRNQDSGKECLRLEAIKDYFITGANSKCPNGFANGYIADLGERQAGKYCYRISSIGKSYITETYTSCAQGFSSGRTVELKNYSTGKTCVRNVE